VVGVNMVECDERRRGSDVVRDKTDPVDVVVDDGRPTDSVWGVDVLGPRQNRSQGGGSGRRQGNMKRVRCGWTRQVVVKSSSNQGTHRRAAAVFSS
jgi:hypothetical protein